jgi:hypothetical protein
VLLKEAGTLLLKGASEYVARFAFRLDRIVPGPIESYRGNPWFTAQTHYVFGFSGDPTRECLVPELGARGICPSVNAGSL